jgi:hypothetical protein
MKKLENLLDFEDFKANWKEKESKKTKRTEIGLDVIEESVVETTTTEEKTEEEINEKDANCPFRKK